MAVFAAAGPFANLATAAAVAPAVTSRALPAIWLGVAISAIAVGCSLGIGNLVPVRADPIGSDGFIILRWILHPTAQRERLEQERLVTGNTADKPAVDVERTEPGTPHGIIDEYAALIDRSDPQAGAAALRLISAIGQAPAQEQVGLIADNVKRFARLVIDGVAPSYAPSLALWIMLNFLADQISPTEARIHFIPLSDLAAVADTALEAAPESQSARSTSAMARMLHGHSNEARQLLLAPYSSSDTAENRARSDVIRALAELDLGDAPQARRLVKRATGTAGVDQVAHLYLVQLLSVVRTDNWRDAAAVVASGMAALLDADGATGPRPGRTSRSLRGALLASYAWIAAVLGAADLQGAAGAACREARSIGANFAAVSHTEAQLRIDLGEAEEGLDSCVSILESTTLGPSSRAEVLATMAIAALRLGRDEDVRRYLAEAEHLCSDAQLLWRIRVYGAYAQ